MSRAAIWSGVLGATASCCAKFAMDPNSSIVLLVQRVICSVEFIQVLHQTVVRQANTSVDPTTVCHWITGGIITRGLCFIAMLICNAYMLGFFLKGMDESGSVAGTALSTASNFIASAAFGYFVWGERFTTMWCVGFGMVTLGVLLLVSGGSHRHDAEHPNTKTD